eukprot:3521952-Pyramimonas_sp.AAC.1
MILAVLPSSLRDTGCHNTAGQLMRASSLSAQIILQTSAVNMWAGTGHENNRLSRKWRPCTLTTALRALFHW